MFMVEEGDLERRLSNVLCVVNSELKALTLLGLDDGFCGRAEIVSRVKEFVGRGFPLVSARTFEQYCSESLVPFGVAVGDEDMGFALSDDGKEYGRNIAAFSLKYAADNGFSLFSVLGGTSSHGTSRSPDNRVAILKSIGEGSLRIVDLERNIGLRNYAVKKHCEKLQRLGFLGFDSCGTPGNRTFGYVVSPERDIRRAERFGKYTNLSGLVIDAVAKTGKANRQELSQQLGYSVVSVSYVLAELERRGFLVREGWEAGRRMSDVSLLEPGREFLGEYMDRVENALQDGPSLGEMKEIRERFIADETWSRETARKAVGLYREVSSMMNARPMEVTNEIVVRFVGAHKGVRSSVILRALGLPNNYTKYLTPLVNSGRLRKVDEGGRCVRYFSV